MKHRLILAMAMLIGLVAGCGKASEMLNDSGEKVGEGTSEFFHGVSEGVDKSRQCTLVLNESFGKAGVKAGKFMVESPDTSRTNHMVTVYLMFEQDFRGPVTLKVFDAKGNEYGRLTEEIAGNKGEAHYFNFIFDKRTDIESQSRIVME